MNQVATCRFISFSPLKSGPVSALNRATEATHVAKSDRESAAVSRGPTLSWLTDSLLCLSSYAPMFFVLGLRFESPHWLRTVSFVLAAIGLVAALYFLFFLRLAGKDTIRLRTVDDRGTDVSGYLATYLLPLVVVGTPNNADIAAYAIVIFIMGLVYVRSNAVQINPMFYIATFRLFAVSNDDGFVGYLLARHAPATNDVLKVVRRGSLLLMIGYADGQSQ